MEEDLKYFPRSIWRIPLKWRRRLILVGAVAMTILAGAIFGRGFFVGPADWLVALGGALLGILLLFGHFSWLLWMIGFIGWRSRPMEKFSPSEPVVTRTAFVMPIYHEDVARVVAGIRKTWLSAKQAGLSPHCDYYILSDSVDPKIRAEEERAEEERAVEELQSIFSNHRQESGHLYLVRRTERVNYKAGNIANFLENHGGTYDFMLVLDADSVMLGACIRRLILKMQKHAHTAVIQSLMSTFRGVTPFGQAMQFSVTRVGAIFSCGFGWFLGNEALYWGHNAILRIAPFMEHAQLPIFPGKPPFGGRVLSQDVHEASLLGRAGWDIELDLEPGGTYEEIPSNVVSYGKRDQRWCTGDFLNSALILSKGFRAGQRFWLAYAISSYSISLVLLSLMLVGFALAVRYGASTIDVTALCWALIYMPLMQLSSKFLLFWLHLERRLSLRRQLVSLAGDILGTLVMTPLLVYQHMTFVIGILVGKAVQWTSPSRDPKDGLSWRLAARVFWAPTVVAAIWIPLAWILSPAFLFFSGIILVPWLFSIPLAVISSNIRFGEWLARKGIFSCRRTEQELREWGIWSRAPAMSGGRFFFWRNDVESSASYPSPLLPSRRTSIRLSLFCSGYFEIGKFTFSSTC